MIIITLVQNANDVLQIVTARELTIGGILLLASIYLGYQLHLIRKELKETQDKRVEDAERYANKYLDMAERNFRHVQQLTELSK